MTKTIHANNFNFLRLLFASLVVFSHSFALLGLEEPVIWGRSLGNLSVHAFFAISGYLICQSYMRSPSLLSFTTNRFLRIVPGLVVAIFVTHAIADFCDGFKSNPVPYVANGPVWTLTWEVACYIGLAILGKVGVLDRQSIPGFFAATWLVYLVNLANTSDPYLVVVPLALMFLAGAYIATMEKPITSYNAPLLAAVGLACIWRFEWFQAVHIWIASNIPFLWGPEVTAAAASGVIYLVAFPVAVIYLGKLSRPAFRIENDISYGVYIYGWPVAQTAVFIAMRNQFSLSPIGFFCLTMLLTIPIAFASWKLVEKPSLSLKKILAQRGPT